jgi:hypothetical protein
MSPRSGSSFRAKPNGGVGHDADGAFSGTFGAATGLTSFRENFKPATEKKDEATIPVPAENFIPPEDDKLYSPKPFYADQFVKHRDTVRWGSIEYKMFTLPQDTDALNEFRKKEIPIEAPELVVVKEEEPRWHEATNTWLVLLRFRRLYYRKIF